MKRIAIAALILLPFSCDDDAAGTACSVNDPVQELPWLAAKVEELGSYPDLGEYYYVSRARYGFQTVFIIGNCCPFCLSVYPVFDCAGNEIGQVGDGRIKPEILDDDELVWSAPGSACNF